MAITIFNSYVDITMLLCFLWFCSGFCCAPYPSWHQEVEGTFVALASCDATATVDTAHSVQFGCSPDLQRNILQFHHLDTQQRQRAAKIATFRNKMKQNIQKYPKITDFEICRSRYRTAFAIPLIFVLLCLQKKYERIKQVLRHPVPGFDDAIWHEFMQSTLFQVTQSLCQSHNRHVLYKTEWRNRFSKQQEILRRHGKIASFWKEMERGQQLQKRNCSCSSQLCSHIAVERLIWCCICLNNSKQCLQTWFQTCLQNFQRFHMRKTWRSKVCRVVVVNLAFS